MLLKEKLWFDHFVRAVRQPVTDGVIDHLWPLESHVEGVGVHLPASELAIEGPLGSGGCDRRITKNRLEKPVTDKNLDIPVVN